MLRSSFFRRGAGLIVGVFALGLVTGTGVSDAVTFVDVCVVRQDIQFRQVSDDDWVPWDRVLGVYNSEQECINVGQALADSTKGRYHCQMIRNGGAWALFY
ncbi:hypothetical protein D5S18_05165 [Nocardia panacis]|uniref:Uncharacterized protein n=1 Tax=Nocardia panacis TaxID=2340916 RepID=A0A3A4KMF1_9NOCA|nr:hypothetical protein [Nocardia panacis]RJO78307.1 hypothetical protein D5S18_05165 [Nocardia panacis]